MYEWEQTLYPLFSHILTSILFVQRPSRHRILVLMNDAPLMFTEALNKVLLNYLNIGSLLLLNGFRSLSYILEGLPSVGEGRPKAHLLVDIGTYEARVVVFVSGLSILVDTYQITMAGYCSFLRRVLDSYREEEDGSMVTTLQDANAIVQAWLSNFAKDATTFIVDLPSHTDSAQTQLSVRPLQKAFCQTYLDYTNPSSLVYALLTSAMACPIDYRRVALQNILLVGGGSTAMRHFIYSKNESDFAGEIVKAARKACGITDNELDKSEEKKDDETPPVSSIARHRFKSLSGCVAGTADESGERKGGANVRYPDPFSADMAAWVGGSIMGSLDLKNEEWMTKSSTESKSLR